MTDLDVAAGLHDMAGRLFADRIDGDAVVVAIGGAEADALGILPASVVGGAAGRLYDAASLRRLRDMLADARPEVPARAFPVTMMRGDGGRLELMAIAVRGGTPERPLLDVFKAPPQDGDGALRDLVEGNEIMRAIIQTAREAIWCIRYDRPVDVTVPVDEIVDQIFEHPSVWCMCNAAMARAYDLHDESELNGRNVRFHWPRNAVNEAFIREVIASGFQVEGAISEDHRRDGSPVLMENDVRAHIADGRLHRLWGTLREVKPGGFELRREKADYAALAFELLPLPACLMRPDGTLITENVSWRLAFGSLGQIAARMAFRSAGGSEYREIVLPLPLASGGTRHHLVTCRWQAMAGQDYVASSLAYLAVTARLMDPDSGAGG